MILIMKVFIINRRMPDSPKMEVVTEDMEYQDCCDHCGKVFGPASETECNQLLVKHMKEECEVLNFMKKAIPAIYGMQIERRC